MKQNENLVIKIKTTGIDLTPMIEAYVRTKIGQLQKFFGHYTQESGEFIFEVEIGRTTKHHQKGDIFRAEINFTVGGNHFRSEAKKDDLYAAINEAKDELSHELRRNKRKAIHLLRRGGIALKNFFRLDK